MPFHDTATEPLPTPANLPRRRTALDWILFAALIAGGSLALAFLPAMVGGGSNSAGYWLCLIGTVLPFVVAMSPLYRILNRPLLARPWYLRPENVIRGICIVIVGGGWVAIELKWIEASHTSVVAAGVALTVFYMTARWRRIR